MKSVLQGAIASTAGAAAVGLAVALIKLGLMYLA